MYIDIKLYGSIFLAALYFFLFSERSYGPKGERVKQSVTFVLLALTHCSINLCNGKVFV